MGLEGLRRGLGLIGAALYYRFVYINGGGGWGLGFSKEPQDNISDGQNNRKNISLLINFLAITK